MKKSLIAFLHLIIICLAYTTPFWLDWKIIFVLILAYYLQILIFGGCILSQAEFGNKEDRFVHHYFEKISKIKVPKNIMDFILDRVIPLILILLAVIYQILLKFDVLVHI